MAVSRTESTETSFRTAIALTRASGSNFHLAFRMLPRPMYRAMCTIYAYMRISDDLVDGDHIHQQQSPLTLAHWREQVTGLMTARPNEHPLFPALRETLTAYPIQLEWLLNVLDGMQRDLDGTNLQSEEELWTYCDQVAGMSGLCCQAIWGANLDQTYDLALICGRAFQLTNILRDLREDAERGRRYLPRTSAIEGSGQDEHPDRTSLGILHSWMLRNEQLYREASQLDDYLVGPGRKMFRIMFATYHSLLEKMLRHPESLLTSRIRLSRAKKAQILIMAPRYKPSALLVPAKTDFRAVNSAAEGSLQKAAT